MDTSPGTLESELTWPPSPALDQALGFLLRPKAVPATQAGERRKAASLDFILTDATGASTNFPQGCAFGQTSLILLPEESRHRFSERTQTQAFSGELLRTSLPGHLPAASMWQLPALHPCIRARPTVVGPAPHSPFCAGICPFPG